MLPLIRIGIQCLVTLSIYITLACNLSAAQATGNNPWVELPGSARDIAVGPNGATWQAGADGNAWRWNGQGWIKVQGRDFQRVAVDKQGNAWAVGKNTVIYYSSENRFIEFPSGRALDIAIGADGSMWVVGTDGSAWRWDAKRWKKVGGRNFVRIAVDPKGNAWALDKQSVIHFYTNNRFKELHTGRAIDIAVGAEGSIWIAGTDYAAWRWDSKNWQKHAGEATNVTVDAKGLPWVLNKKGKIYADKRSASYKSPPRLIAAAPAQPVKPVPPPANQVAKKIPWVRVYGKARDLSVGANGAVWQVGADGNAWRWNGKSWIKVAGRNLQRLAVDKDGTAWAIGKDRVIYRSTQDRFEAFHTGRALDIGIGANGVKWVVGTDRAAWRLSGNNWQKVGGANIERIAVDYTGNAWVVNNRNEIYHYVGGSNFNKLPGSAKDIGVGADGSVWIAGMDSVPYRWNGNGWLKHTGGITDITVDPKGLPWAINAAGEIYADNRSISYKKPPQQLASTPGSNTTGTGSQHKANMLKEAEQLIKTIPALASNWSAWLDAFKKDGEVLKADVRLFNQTATIVIYRPKGKSGVTEKVNVAVLTRLIKISNLIPKTADTFLDDTQVKDATYIFAPKGHAENIDTQELPTAVRQYVEKVRTGPISIVEGNNMFGIVNAYGTTDDVLQKINVPLKDLKINAAYGQKRSEHTGSDYKTDPYNAVRLTRAGEWQNPFRVENTKLKNPTLEYIKLGNVKTIRGWGYGALKGESKEKDYFMFLQKTGPGSWPTAVALDAKSVTLEDYKDLLLVFGKSLFGSKKYVSDLLSGIGKLPLNRVLIENPNYTEGGALDKNNNPVFDNVLVMGVAKGDSLPDPKKTQGAAFVVHGNAKIFGHPAGSAEGWFQDEKGMDLTATVNFPGVGNIINLGSYRVKLKRIKSKNEYEMAFTGHARVKFQGETVINESVTMHATNTSLQLSVGESCPIRYVGFDISIDINSWQANISPRAQNPAGCAAALVLAAAEEVARRARQTGAIAVRTVDETNSLMRNIGGSISELLSNTWDSASDEVSGWFSDDDSSTSDPKKVMNCNFPYVAWEGSCQWDMALGNYNNSSATQSSRANKSYNAGMLIDESRGNNFTQTQNEANPWMFVDLGETRWVDNVVLFGRQDTNYLDGALVALSNKYAGQELMLKQDPEIYRTKLGETGGSVTIRPGKWGQGQWARYIIVYYLPTDNKTRTLALTEIMAFSNHCRCENFWRRVPGAARDIAADINNRKMWHVGSNGNLYFTNVNQIQRLVKPVKNAWTRFPSVPDPNNQIQRMTVDYQGEPWVLVDGGRIYRHRKGAGWSLVQGRASDIAAVGISIVMVATGGQQIYERVADSDDKQHWNRLEGVTGVQVSAGKNAVWLVKNNGEIYRNTNFSRNRLGFQKVQGKALTVTNLDGNTAFSIGIDETPQAFNYRTRAWTSMPKQGRNMAIDHTGRPWLIDGDIWVWWKDL